MKKVISTLAAAMMAATSLASTVANAINVPVFNEYSLATSTVGNDIIIDDITVPAGSLAVTVNITNNSGFSSSSINVALGDAYAPITDGDGVLVVESGSVIGDSCIFGAANGGLITVATASAEDNLSDGDMFTFYVSSNTSSDAETIEILNTESENISTTLRKVAAAKASAGGYFQVGDVDNDGRVNSSDSSYVLHAIAQNNDEKLSVSTANADLSYYFPYAPNIVCAQTANPLCPANDDDEDDYVDDDELRAGLLKGSINKADADDILSYYAYSSTGQFDKYHSKSDGFCGRILHT